MADLPPVLENLPLNAPPPPDSLLPSLAPKRQRRPSVRLGDIGEQPAAAASYESQARRVPKQWKLPPHLLKDLPPASAAAGKGLSRTRPLMTLGNGDCPDALDGDEAAGGRRPPGKDFRGRRGGGAVTKRVRSNWVTRADEGHEGVGMDLLGGDGEEFRDFDMEGSPARSPVENMDLHGHGRRLGRSGVADDRDEETGELGVPSEDEDDWKREGNGGGSRAGMGGEDGVRMWLNGLGLGRYAPVFEIHEVDDEVLPFLTMEDLKEMGINAVGSRRKMFCSIQKIAKSPS